MPRPRNRDGRVRNYGKAPIPVWLVARFPYCYFPVPVLWERGVRRCRRGRLTRTRARTQRPTAPSRSSSFTTASTAPPMCSSLVRLSHGGFVLHWFSLFSPFGGVVSIFGNGDRKRHSESAYPRTFTSLRICVLVSSVLPNSYGMIRFQDSGLPPWARYFSDFIETLLSRLTKDTDFYETSRASNINSHAKAQSWTPVWADSFSHMSKIGCDSSYRYESRLRVRYENGSSSPIHMTEAWIGVGENLVDVT